MGFGDFLFGSKPKSKTKSQTVLTPEQETLLSELIGSASGGGTFGLDPSQLELKSLAGLEALSSALPEAQTEGSKAATSAGTAGISALEDIFTRGPTDFEDFFRTNIQDPLKETFDEDILGIGTRFAADFFGGERRKAETDRREDFIDALVRSRESAALGFREQDTNAILQGLGVLPQAGGFAATSESLAPDARMRSLLALLGAGGTERNIVQQQLDEAQRRKALSLGIPAFENITTITGGSPGLISTAVGALAGNPAIGSIFNPSSVASKTSGAGGGRRPPPLGPTGGVF